MKIWNDLNTKQKRNIIIGIIALITAYFVYRFVRKQQYTNVSFDRQNIPQVPTGSQGQTISWNPRPLAEEIFQNIEGWNVILYPETADKILALNNDQTIYLYNFYNQYLAQEYPSLTQLFDNEWDDWSGKYNKVVARLKGLGLR